MQALDVKPTAARPESYDTGCQTHTLTGKSRH